MPVIGDIVSLLFPDAIDDQKETGKFLVIGKNGTPKGLTLAHLTTDIERRCSEDFTETISPFDLEEGTLKEDHLVLVYKLMTVNSGQCEKVAAMKMDKLDKILRLFSHYAGYSHYQSRLDNRRASGNNIPPSGKVLDENDLYNMVDASLDMWLTAGRFHDKFENSFAEFLGIRHALAVNSGSSANLLALSALTSHRLGEDRLKESDEVITVAAAFPTTVAPIVQNGLTPVFVDVELVIQN
jgi:hypothetical protein